MKVIHLSLSAGGGAGIAAARGVKALRELGTEAELWTADGSVLGPALRTRPWTLARIWLDCLPLRFYRKARLFSAWSNNRLPTSLANQINRARPDVVHLHWIGGGFFSLRELAKLQAPVVWTLHDAWALTGGCHYPDGCKGYEAECGECPQLGSSQLHDLSWRNLRTKRALLGGVAAFITPSAWLGGLVRASGVADDASLHVIFNGLDGSIYAPADFQHAREALSLPPDALVLVAGAQNLEEPRKGCGLLREVMAGVVAATNRRCVLVMFGANGGAANESWPCEVRWLGTLPEGTETARVYNAADVLLMPSLQDNLPNMPLEALGCGCPTVGFDSGGLSEIIETGATGELALEKTGPSLAAAVTKWCARGDERQEISRRCRARFERCFNDGLHAGRLMAVYESVLAKAGRVVR